MERKLALRATLLAWLPAAFVTIVFGNPFTANALAHDPDDSPEGRWSGFLTQVRGIGTFPNFRPSTNEDQESWRIAIETLAIPVLLVLLAVVLYLGFRYVASRPFTVFIVGWAALVLAALPVGAVIRGLYWLKLEDGPLPDLGKGPGSTAEGIMYGAIFGLYLGWICGLAAVAATRRDRSGAGQVRAPLSRATFAGWLPVAVVAVLLGSPLAANALQPHGLGERHGLTYQLLEQLLTFPSTDVFGDDDFVILQFGVKSWAVVLLLVWLAVALRLTVRAIAPRGGKFGVFLAGWAALIVAATPVGAISSLVPWALRMGDTETLFRRGLPILLEGGALGAKYGFYLGWICGLGAMLFAPAARRASKAHGSVPQDAVSQGFVPQDPIPQELAPQGEARRPALRIMLPSWLVLAAFLTIAGNPWVARAIGRATKPWLGERPPSPNGTAEDFFANSKARDRYMDRARLRDDLLSGFSWPGWHGDRARNTFAYNALDVGVIMFVLVLSGLAFFFCARMVRSRGGMALLAWGVTAIASLIGGIGLSCGSWLLADASQRSGNIFHCLLSPDGLYFSFYVGALCALATLLGGRVSRTERASDAVGDPTGGRAGSPALR